ncbi:MAG: hypothetical protein AB7O97_14670 [Planctomycetota bacterium]
MDIPRKGLFAFALIASAVAQEPVTDVGALTAELQRAPSVDAEGVGIDGARSPTYDLYTRWRDAATIAQLRACTRHENPVVRAYAVRALVDRDADVDWVALLRDHVDDTAKVTTFVGCCLAEEMVGDVMFGDLRRRFDEDQRQDAAELLIRAASPLAAREYALRALRLRDGMLHTVRELAANGDLDAGVALARYRLPVDVPVLQRHLETLRERDPWAENAPFLAAALHPDPRLLPALRAFERSALARIGHDNPSRLRHWIAAVAAQRSADAAVFLVRFLDAARPQSDFKERDLLRTLKEALADHGGDALEEFDALRAALARREAAAAR